MEREDRQMGRKNMRMVSEICWLAGLLEGEGNFHSAHSLMLRCAMTDLDTMERVSEMFKWPLSHTHTPAGKPYYTIQINGINAYQWMVTIYPIMGKRRQERIREIVREWLKKWKN